MITKKDFLEYFSNDRYIVTDEKKLNNFYNYVNTHWDEIENSFITVNGLNKVLSDSMVGIVKITAASDLDAQNIFSLVNSGGTQLTAEELLSAKPFWNIPVNNPSKYVNEKVAELYQKLDIVQPDDVVRWDLCATLISRLDKDCFVFTKADDSKISAMETTLGFKLISSIFVGGISSKCVSDIENYNGFNWDTDYEELIGDLNDLISIIYTHPYFKCMQSWGQTVMSLTSNTIALEFITLLYNEWKKMGKPKVDNNETKTLKRNAVILLDKLIYEYSNKQWRGSSDSKLAKDIENSSDRFKAKESEDWQNLLKDMARGEVNDQVVTQNLVKPILFHSKFLQGVYSPFGGNNQGYDIDHIYPQDKFKNNSNVNQHLKDSLINLEILSSSANESKNNKDLKEVNENDIKDEITKSSWIPETEFTKFSDISNITDLLSFRLNKFEEIFTEDRNRVINN